MTGPMRPDLSDTALFAPSGSDVEALADHHERTLAAVEAAMRVFHGANLPPHYGFDQEDAVKLWTAKLVAYSPTAVLRAADEWVTAEGAEFPTLPEFTTLVASKDRALRRPPEVERPPGQECPECGEEGGWVFATRPLDGGIADRRPCSICRPVQLELHRAGHFGPREGSASCHCNHPVCPDTKRREKANA